MQTHWKLEGTLRRFGKTPMALARASGLTKTTIYNIVNNNSQAVQLETLDKLLIGLENLTGQHFSVADVLEREVKPNAFLEELLQDAKRVDFAELDKHIPDWTDEERIENQAFLQILEQERSGRLERQVQRDAELLEIFAPKTKSEQKKA
jgi:transcriptional regulator with XRE-family HTH domain